MAEAVTSYVDGPKLGGFGGTQTFALNNNWLDQTTSTFWVQDTFIQPYIQPYVHYCNCRTHTKKVTLSLRDVNKLQTAAKKDSKLRDILYKLTDLIEVEINFDG